MDGTSLAGRPEKRFNLGLGHLATFAIIFGVLLAAAIWFGYDRAQSPEAELEAVLLLIGLPLELFVLLVVGTRGEAVVVTCDGLRWKADYREHEVAWRAITHARSYGLFGVRYARLESSDHQHDLWLPLSVANRADFYSFLIETAGPDHCLTRLLGCL